MDFFFIQVKKGSAPKPVAKEKTEVEEDDDDAILDRFSLELRWCIQQIELAMEKKKSSAKEGTVMDAVVVSVGHHFL